MKRAREFLWRSLVSGALIVLPSYLALLLLLRAMETVANVLKPVTSLFPSWLPALNLLSLLAVLLLCLAVGVAVRTASGRSVRERLERSLLSRLLGYSFLRSLTNQPAERTDKPWKPALAELEDALVPAFVVEEHEDGRYTVFVPSVPTPLMGAVYVLPAERVHCLDVGFAEAIKPVYRWGFGSRDLVAAMKPRVT